MWPNASKDGSQCLSCPPRVENPEGPSITAGFRLAIQNNSRDGYQKLRQSNEVTGFIFFPLSVAVTSAFPVRSRSDLSTSRTYRCLYRVIVTIKMK